MPYGGPHGARRAPARAGLEVPMPTWSQPEHAGESFPTSPCRRPRALWRRLRMRSKLQLHKGVAFVAIRGATGCPGEGGEAYLVFFNCNTATVQLERFAPGKNFKLSW